MSARISNLNPFVGYEMRDVGDGYHELVVVRGVNVRALHAMFHSYPEKMNMRQGISSLLTQRKKTSGSMPGGETM